MMWEHRRRQPSTSISQGVRLEKDPSLLAPRKRALTSWPWTYRLQNCEMIKFCCFSHSICGTLLQSEQTNTGDLPYIVWWWKTKSGSTPSFPICMAFYFITLPCKLIPWFHSTFSPTNIYLFNLLRTMIKPFRRWWPPPNPCPRQYASP